MALSEEEELELIKLYEEEERERARKSLYYFCQMIVPSFFIPGRTHLKEWCDALQEFLEDPEAFGLIINCPPRHGKTLTVEMATAWYLGHNPDLGIMAASYNELLAGRFSKTLRGVISTRKAGFKTVYSDIFPEVRIQSGDSAKGLWALEGSHFSFLATSPGGTATGVGCQLLVIDDLIRNALESNNERVLEGQANWYYNTVKSRLEIGGKQIIIQTRWAEKDLTGILLVNEPDKWKVIKMQAWDGEKMLDPSIMTKETYEERKKFTDPVIFSANYDQTPFDSVDRLYGELKTYQPGTIPKGRVAAYFDTADEGSDYLAGACYIVANGTAYITDLIYTQEPMEATESRAAVMLADQKTEVVWMESNNGGRGFARNVERIMRETIGYTGCNVRWFHQSDNKKARILATSTNVMNSIIMPHDWKTRWPLFHSHVTKAPRMAKLIHDDFADLLAGIVEKSLIQESVTFLF